MKRRNLKFSYCFFIAAILSLYLGSLSRCVIHYTYVYRIYGTYTNIAYSMIHTGLCAYFLMVSLLQYIFVFNHVSYHRGSYFLTYMNFNYKLLRFRMYKCSNIQYRYSTTRYIHVRIMLRIGKRLKLFQLQSFTTICRVLSVRLSLRVFPFSFSDSLLNRKPYGLINVLDLQ